MSKKILYATNFCLMTFVSTHHALRAEKTLEKSGLLDFLIVPTPREISNGCGLAIKFFNKEQEKIIDLLKESEINYDSIYSFEKNAESKTLISKII